MNPGSIAIKGRRLRGLNPDRISPAAWSKLGHVVNGPLNDVNDVTLPMGKTRPKTHITGRGNGRSDNSTYRVYIGSSLSLLSMELHTRHNL